MSFVQAAEGCDVFLNYAPHSTVAECLLAGKPGVVMPDNQERILVATRMVQLGAGIALAGDGSAKVGDALQRVLDDPSYRQAAERFSASVSHLDRSRIFPTIARGRPGRHRLTGDLGTPVGLGQCARRPTTLSPGGRIVRVCDDCGPGCGARTRCWSTRSSPSWSWWAGLVSLTADPTPDHPTPPDALAVVLVVVGFGAIALRRRFPVPVLAVVSVATIAYLVRDYPDNGLPVMALIALYTVASLRRRAVWATAVLVYLALLLLAAVTSPDELSVGDFIGNIAVYGIAAVLGDSAWPTPG